MNNDPSVSTAPRQSHAAQGKIWLGAYCSIAYQNPCTGTAPRWITTPHHRSDRYKQETHPVSTGSWMSPNGHIISDEDQLKGRHYPFNYKLSLTEPREVLMLSITSPKLTAFLADVSNEFGSHWDDKFVETQPSQTECNLWRIIWCWNLVSGRQLDSSNSQARDELYNLVNVLKDFKPLDEVIQMSDAQKKYGTIVFDNLWSLFPPGEIIFAASDAQLQVLLVNQASYKSIAMGIRSASANKVMEISCCYYGKTKFLF
ncbi:hypothetical protein N7478_008746 [Penicillium angulare]|uniref:uncharacterized protein n=1 Tax=Penicillium angulare TaxID=116970 RepID=UPI0025413AE8|nr:uncharacterized protein N7478_008746 [Penicillium angulare]KAJ5273621.1 hypothetical protein N7478_008746 [Penicillium angulare]